MAVREVLGTQNLPNSVAAVPILSHVPRRGNDVFLGRQLQGVFQGQQVSRFRPVRMERRRYLRGRLEREQVSACLITLTDSSTKLLCFPLGGSSLKLSPYGGGSKHPAGVVYFQKTKTMGGNRE